MSTPLQFAKLEGCGNNFIVIYDDVGITPWAAIAKRLLDPNFALGSDGLMVVKPRAHGRFPVEMYNPDGSPCGMCGNGIRCVTRYLYLLKVLSETEHEVPFTVHDREITCHSSNSGMTVMVDLGAPSFSPSLIPIDAPGEFVNQPIEAGRHRFLATAVSMGNPHCVIFVPSLDEISLPTIGPLLETHALFPRRANIEFVQCLSAARARVKVWERGAGATLACGTGAGAVAVAGTRLKLLSPSTTIELPGGEVQIDYRTEVDRVFLTGPAREIYRGELFSSFLNALLGNSAVQ